VLGALTEGFVLPNQMTAAQFALEVRPSHYFAVNGGRLPMGGHAWSRYEPAFWRQHVPEILAWENESRKNREAPTF
jgi:hypothetical protein